MKCTNLWIFTLIISNFKYLTQYRNIFKISSKIQYYFKFGVIYELYSKCFLAFILYSCQFRIPHKNKNYITLIFKNFIKNEKFLLNFQSWKKKTQSNILSNDKSLLSMLLLMTHLSYNYCYILQCWDNRPLNLDRFYGENN